MKILKVKSILFSLMANPNLDPQIQIWTSTFENCECMLNQFLSECGDNLISFSACYQKTSNYPPDPEVCTI